MSPTIGSYLSSHAAEVILSEVRHTAFAAEALELLNALLDELLYSILKAAGNSPLSSDRIRQGLLQIIPTSLGQSALLEAEIELRAYLERSQKPVKAQTHDIPLEWAFQLLRLKCQALSTLSDTSEESQHERESQIRDNIIQAGGKPPPLSLLVPAALYATAIIEFTCEHILANVSRVVSRDSSRANAGALDLFTALCEDHSIYDTFKSLQVYNILDEMTKQVPPRRSKSLSRSEKLTPFNRTNSPRFDNRTSSDSSNVAGSSAPSLTQVSSRSSSEKKKKLFGGSRASGEEHKSYDRAESILSEETQRMWTAYADINRYDDEAMMREFDELMRSDATLTLSLTPDRLRNGELGRKKTRPDVDENPQPLSGHRPSLTIIEDEESQGPKQQSVRRKRLASLSTFTTNHNTRIRNRTTSTINTPVAMSNSSRKQRIDVFDDERPTPPLNGSISKKGLSKRISSELSGFPPKTRTRGHNRESPNLEDIMAGPAENVGDFKSPPKTPITPKSTRSAVSQSTKELMDFLDAGPPDSLPPVSKASKDLIAFLASAPSPNERANLGLPAPSESKASTGRLQRMISKLSIGASDRNKASSLVQDKSKAGGVTPLLPPMPPAPKPIPPRYRPISPPPDNLPQQEHQPMLQSAAVCSYQQTSGGKSQSNLSESGVTRLVANCSVDIEESGPSDQKAPDGTERGLVRQQVPVPHIATGSLDETLRSAGPQPGQTESVALGSTPGVAAPKAVPILIHPASPCITEDTVHTIRGLFASATSADECRVIMDMFMARSKIPLDDFKNPYPSPTPSDEVKELGTLLAVSSLECSLVECLLGGGDSLA